MAEQWSADLPDWLQELRDREEIRRLLLLYARGIDRLDEGLIRQAFHPDAVDDHGPRKSDVDGLMAWLHEHKDGPEQMVHLIANCTVELFGDRAVAETYSVAFHRFAAGAAKSHFGAMEASGEHPTRMTTLYRYVDRLERRDARWAITYRTMVMEDAWMNVSGMAPPDPEQWVAPHRDAGDALYDALRWASGESPVDR